MEPSIHFQKRGQGNPLVLLHGFPLNAAIWDDFAARLATSFTVITPDLPGFGKSELLPEGFSIDDVASVLLKWMTGQSWKNPVLIGHSLGGYVALAMADKEPHLFSGLGLFHSTAYADNDEKKQSRNKVLDFVQKSGALPFTTNFIAPLFADPQHPGIEEVRAIASSATAGAVLGYTRAMRDRPDRTHLLRTYQKPILFITGEKDGGIPVDSIKNQASLVTDASVFVLRDHAHMGMVEDPGNTATLIKEFTVKCF